MSDCGNCRFFSPIEGTNLGECHRYAPRPIIDNPNANFSDRTLWPEVRVADHCAEFEPVEKIGEYEPQPTQPTQPVMTFERVGFHCCKCRRLALKLSDDKPPKLIRADSLIECPTCHHKYCPSCVAFGIVAVKTPPI